MKPRCFLTTIVGAALTGCAGEPENLNEVVWDRPAKPPETALFDSAGDEADVEALVVPEDSRCEPMADDGACALVCDPDALIEHYVPPGTCIHFVCTTRDGSSHHLGACR
jgi:hypothetical protein